MHDFPCANTKQPSHFQYVIGLDRRHSLYKLKQEAYEYMDQLTGQCSHAKASVLIDTVTRHKPETIVEIGVWGGKSLISMACAVRANGKGMVYGIDPWSSQVLIQDAKNEINKAWGQEDLRNLIVKKEQFGLTDYITLIQNTSL